MTHAGHAGHAGRVGHVAERSLRKNESIKIFLGYSKPPM